MGFPEDIIALKECKEIRTFVETGSGVGLITERIGALFENVIAIEKSEKLLNIAKNYVHNLDNIKWVLGDSEEVLPSVIEGNKDSIGFYLNACHCEPIKYYGDGELSLIESEKPKEGTSALERELKIILNCSSDMIIVVPETIEKEKFTIFGDRLIRHEIVDGHTYVVVK